MSSFYRKGMSMNDKERKDNLKISASDYGCDFIDLEQNPPVKEHVYLVTRDIAEKYTIVIFNRKEDVLWVAMTNPLNVFAIDEIQQTTGLKVLPFLSEEEETKDTLRVAYESD